MNYYFNIADIIIKISTPFKVNWHSSIKQFIINPTNSINVYYILYISDMLITSGNILYQDNRQIIMINDHYEERLYFFFGQSLPCMLYKEKNNENIIFLNQSFINSFTRNDVYCIFNALAFEKVLINYNAIILHCSYIIINNKAILFTAPSGEGKSTQAHLWQKYENAKIINSDRAIIKKKNNIYYAMGIPIDGSSDICLNQSTPIISIVYLHKYHGNVIEKMNQKNEIKKIISETTINFFNQEFIDKAFNIITDISKYLPMYELWCTKDKQAITCLKNKLQEDSLL